MRTVENTKSIINSIYLYHRLLSDSRRNSDISALRWLKTQLLAQSTYTSRSRFWTQFSLVFSIFSLDFCYFIIISSLCVISLPFALCYVYLTRESKCHLVQVAKNGFHFGSASLSEAQSRCHMRCFCAVCINMIYVCLDVWFVFMYVLTNIKQCWATCLHSLRATANGKLCTNASYVSFRIHLLSTYIFDFCCTATAAITFLLTLTFFTWCI